MLERVPGLVLLTLAVILMAQSAIALTSWDPKKPKNTTNYYFTVFTAIISLVGIFAGIYLTAKPPPSFGGGIVAVPKLEDIKNEGNLAKRRGALAILTRKFTNQRAAAIDVFNEAEAKFGAAAAAAAEAASRLKTAGAPGAATLAGGGGTGAFA